MMLRLNYDSRFIAAAAFVVLFVFAVFYMSHVTETYAAPTFSTTFDTTTRNEKIDDPTDVVLDQRGDNIYVVHGDKIGNFYKDGGDVKFSKYIGSDLITKPSSIARIDRDYFVLDDGNIIVIDDDGNRKMTFDTRELGQPTDIATHDSLVFVSDESGDKIHVFDDDGTYKYDVSKLTNNDDMSDPRGVAIDTKSDYMYVSDSGKNRIAIFKLIDENRLCEVGMANVTSGVCFVKTFGISGSKNAQFQNPTKLTVDLMSSDSRGDLYVADTNNHRIQIFRFAAGNECPDGTQNVTSASNGVTGSVCFVGVIGQSGTDNEQFKKPSGLAIDSKDRLLYVADTGNDRVQVIKLDGQVDTSSSSTTTTTTTTTQSKKPNTPRAIDAIPTSPESILVKWSEPLPKGDPPIHIIGYKVEYKEKTATTSSSSDFTLLVAKTATNSTSIHHTNLDPNTTYTYRVYAVGAGGDAAATSLSSNTASAKPAMTQQPIIIQGVALAPKQIKLSWLPPSETVRQSITGYVVEKAISSSSKYADVDTVGGTTTEFVYTIVNGAETKYKFVITAKFGAVSSPKSEPVTVTVDSDSSHSGIIQTQTIAHKKLSEPSPPLRVQAESVSENSIDVSWRAPTDSGNTPITGYVIEAKKKGASSFMVLASDLDDTAYRHKGIDTGSEYTYRVFATNAIGNSTASNESTATARTVGITLDPIGSKTVDEGQFVTFTARVSGESGVTFRLSDNAPTGASISPNTGVFRWTPVSGDGGDSFVFDVIATKGQYTDAEAVRIRVNAVSQIPDTSLPSDSDLVSQQPSSSEPKLAEFVKDGVDPQTYIDRYDNEQTFREWFDANYLDQFDSIYDAVGILRVPAEFVDHAQEPQYYIDRYNAEESYRIWFDENYSEYDSIHHAVGLTVESDEESDKDSEEKDPKRTSLPRLDVPLAPFVDAAEDPMTYVDRYNTDDLFKEWFDTNHAAEYKTIYRAVGLLDVPALFVDASEDPMTYVDRYNTDDLFKEWFDENYSEYLSIYHAVGLPEPLLSSDDVSEQEPVKHYGICGPGTMLVEGVCTIIDTSENDNGA